MVYQVTALPCSICTRQHSTNYLIPPQVLAPHPVPRFRRVSFLTFPLRGARNDIMTVPLSTHQQPSQMNHSSHSPANSRPGSLSHTLSNNYHSSHYGSVKVEDDHYGVRVRNPFFASLSLTLVLTAVFEPPQSQWTVEPLPHHVAPVRTHRPRSSRHRQLAHTLLFGRARWTGAPVERGADSVSSSPRSSVEYTPFIAIVASRPPQSALFPAGP